MTRRVVALARPAMALALSWLALCAPAAAQEHQFRVVPGLRPPTQAQIEAAQRGDAKAQWQVGGVLLDDADAFPWIARAAEHGQPDAQVRMAGWLTKGTGMAKDPEAAATWLLRSARQGTFVAMYRLSHAYSDAAGLPRDLVLAMAWNLAARRAIGFKVLSATVEREKVLAALMTEDQRNAAIAAAAAWHPGATIMAGEAPPSPFQPGAWNFDVEAGPVTPLPKVEMQYTNRLSRCLARSDLADMGMLTGADPTRCVVTGKWSAPDRLDWQAHCGITKAIEQHGTLVVIDSEHAHSDVAMTLDGAPFSAGSFEMTRSGSCDAQAANP